MSERIAGLDAGADDYLVKPVEFSELWARMRAVTRRSVGKTVPTLACRNVARDVARQAVTCDGQPVTLSACDYRTLLAFMERPGHIIARSHPGVARDGGQGPRQVGHGDAQRRHRRRIDLHPHLALHAAHQDAAGWRRSAPAARRRRACADGEETPGGCVEKKPGTWRHRRHGRGNTDDAGRNRRAYRGEPWKGESCQATINGFLMDEG
ncbi:response regulator transcription factor [Massilia timonae]|uniref:response regulator transcription factor n=1 Tax=Massilia timonae TaxID=47229 RepID=UPI0023553E5B|nr:hypothetical protein [Massilia timonae]